jgi:hypothetical protein
MCRAIQFLYSVVFVGFTYLVPQNLQGIKGS